MLEIEKKTITLRFFSKISLRNINISEALNIKCLIYHRDSYAALLIINLKIRVFMTVPQKDSSTALVWKCLEKLPL